ncbi:MAG: hypothetical protein WC806_02945 [Candidatus Gracilibacteria bacterium]|jgi:hypothetical protein
MAFDRNRFVIRWGLILGTIVSANVDAYGEPNCNTALGRVAKTLVTRAVSDNKDRACAGLKKGPIGIDRTKKLGLSDFKLCEDGPIVSAEVSADIECGTSDAAFIRVSVEDTLTATASADLDSCRVLDTKVSAKGELANVGIKIADLSAKLKEAAEKEIKPYCK